MGSYRGNADKVMADAKKIVRRLRAGSVGIKQLTQEYDCAYTTIWGAVRTEISLEEWRLIKKKRRAKWTAKTHFRKGRAPWNKGRKGMHLSPATEFKKGCLPANHRAVGTVTIRNDKCGKQFRWIATAGPTPRRHKWIPYARYLYQQKYGPIPEGHFVVHVDGDTLNDDLANLRLVNRSQHLKLQTERDPEMRKRGRLNLKKALKERWARYREERARLEAVKEIEAAKEALRGPLVSWWECIGCGFNFAEEPTGICPKCNGFRFTRIVQRQVA